MYQRILVPIDGSITSNRGLDEAIKLAKLMGASLRLIHAADALTFSTGFEPYGVYHDQVIPQMRATGHRILKKAEARAEGEGVKADSVLREDLGTQVSDTVIAQAKEWKADLIVIGTHGRRGIGRWLMGSDAEQIVRKAPVPVLLVRASDQDLKAELSFATAEVGVS
ncbi:universal stress protein [Rhodoferax lacus]|uniref:Universal stress protein n=1 Tax=Rhodoferax lacus TaxID=2184758 RepID=A0A3E1R5U6_9BURK|nr:universal stress protein [Rhodoferax lacus]RFO94657.1 universal stress protein [Rhodoferax lacus]